MLANIIGKGLCQAALRSTSNQPMVFVGDALIWAIISSGIGMALFLNQIAQLKLTRLCGVRQRGFILFFGEFL